MTSGSVCAASGDSADTPRANILIIQSLIDRASRDVIERAKVLPGTPVLLRVQPASDRWIIEQALSSALLRAGCTVKTDSGTAGENSLAVGVQPLGISVGYGAAFRDGLFGTRRTPRTVNCVLAFVVTERNTGTIRLSRTVTETSSDTVEVGQIGQLEDPASRTTQGVRPDDPLLDRIAEPLVIIGATGVIIYLFFHIRS